MLVDDDSNDDGDAKDSKQVELDDVSVREQLVKAIKSADKDAVTAY